LEKRMAQILIRDLKPETVASLKERAAHNKRSLQSEVKLLLEKAAGAPTSLDSLRATAARIEAEARRPQKTDSVELLREDRYG
jgi:plasmid stability protein